MDINAYLDRIAYRGEHTPSLETLTRLHQAHLRAITYENLDIHLGRYLALDERAMFDKMVTGRRGGWRRRWTPRACRRSTQSASSP